MKTRILSLLAALCLTLSLAGCGGGAQEVHIDLDAFYATVAEQADFPMMTAVDSGMMDGFYPGLSQIQRMQTVIYTAAISATACEIALVEVADADDVSQVERIFQARVDAQVAGGAWYPDTIQTWQTRSQILVRGNYVALFVTPEELVSPADAFLTA